MERFSWGTCLHYLLRNDGTKTADNLGVIGLFKDVASDTTVTPSPLMPPRSLDKKRIHPDWDAPTGLGAYDFGYGTTFFDFDNDGYQDVYWLGSEGPPGNSSYPAAGRLLRGDGKGAFEDVTVRAHLQRTLKLVENMKVTTPQSRMPMAIESPTHQVVPMWSFSSITTTMETLTCGWLTMDFAPTCFATTHHLKKLDSQKSPTQWELTNLGTGWDLP